MSIESLVNKGCIVVNEPVSPTGKRTIVVLGTARGGTSIAAGSLYHLGLPMFAVHEPVFEEINLSAAFESGDRKRYQKIIKNFNKEPIWAWKRPSIIDYLPQAEKELRNPMFVVMVRDVLSVGARNGLSMGHDVIESMQNALLKQQKLLDFIKTTKSPVLLCSVEKIKQYPADFVHRLISFTQTSPTNTQIYTAIDFIEPEPMKYIEASRINRSHGRIGGVANNILYGWAAWSYRSQAVEVDLIKNDEVIATVEAIDWREHGIDVKNKRNGYCGFKFDLTKLNIQIGDILHARVKGEVRDLNNSPYLVKPENLSQSHTKDGGSH